MTTTTTSVFDTAPCDSFLGRRSSPFDENGTRQAKIQTLVDSFVSLREIVLRVCVCVCWLKVLRLGPSGKNRRSLSSSDDTRVLCLLTCLPAREGSTQDLWRKDQQPRSTQRIHIAVLWSVFFEQNKSKKKRNLQHRHSLVWADTAGQEERKAPKKKRRNESKVSQKMERI